MNLKRLAVLWFGACALLGLALWFVRAGDTDAPPSPPALATPETTQSPPPALSGAPTPPPEAAPQAPPEAASSRVRLAPPAPKKEAPVAQKNEDSDPPTGGVDPSIPLSAEGISSVFPQLRESIAECIDAWAEVDPSISGSVVLSFTLGPNGVQDAWLSERGDMPAAVTGCFSTAVYEQAWPPAPSGIEVTLPFEVDAGLAPAEPGGALKDRRGEAPPSPD